jgi:hypothetical protein
MPKRLPYLWFRCGCSVWPLAIPAPMFCKQCGEEYQRIDPPPGMEESE